jgi:DNA-binding transcriptional ArsR family regulator/uncharacterized protein YndB with AHSA1/START domain
MKVTDSPAVWEALAHPLRRRLVELLADGPRTTGHLARAFTVTRFAVMKHLRVLERSGLVSVHRRGRECWNALTVPSGPELRVGLNEGSRMPSHLAGVSPSGQQPAPAAGPTDMPLSALEPFRVDLTVHVDAPPSRVFDALTFNVSAWWGAPYLRSSRATHVVLEPQLGGRLFEQWGHRQGFIRGTIVAILQDERIELAGRIAGGSWLPAALAFRLDRTERGTRLEVVHQGLAEPSADRSADAEGRYERAWSDLVGVRLKAFVEDGVRSGLVERPAPADALFGWF